MLYGSIASIPGIKIVVPSNPADAGGFMLSAIQDEHPVLYLEHKMLTDNLMYFLGGSGRDTVEFDIPPNGVEGEIPDKWEPLEFGKLNVLKKGTDITFASLGVGVHRCMEAAAELEKEGIPVEVLDLRTVVPLDIEGIKNSVEKTGKLLVIDEDYKQFGLTGEIAASLLEIGIKSDFARVATEGTIPFSRKLEDLTLPNVEKIVTAAKKLLKK
jgi:pyruvate dehydrogenase E1 component beta subunit